MRARRGRRLETLRVLVTTYNEERNLERCLASASFADEIWVVDSFSTDRTPELARAAGARFVQRAYDSPSDQKNWALDQMPAGWVLILDADESVTAPLQAEIRATLAAPRHSAFWIPRRSWFLGKMIRHAGWDKDGVVRLLRQDAGRYECALVHERMVCRGSVGRLRNYLEHQSYHSLADYLERMQRYAASGGLQLHRRGVRAGADRVLARPPARFLRMYFWQKGFLDGRHGFLLCVLTALQIGLKHAIHWAYAKGLAEDPDERSR